jgi:hypothetical protein
MKKIEQITYRKGGEEKVGSFLEARIINDDLKSNCTFYWSVREEIIPITIEGETVEPIESTPGMILDEGNILMGSEEYLEWDGSNDAAYLFVTGKLNLVLIP